jgi:hypothetical protein
MPRSSRALSHLAAPLVAAALGLAPTAVATAQSTDDSLRIYAVFVGGLYGVYLGQGLIITAAHVVGDGPARVGIAGLDLPAKVIKSSPFDQLDLALLSIDEEKKLPIGLRLRRMPLCQGVPVVGGKVIVATPRGTARSQIASPNDLPRDVRLRFATSIIHVKSTGNSGSGVFDADKKCLLGIMSRKIQVRSPSGESTMDVAKYFVPAAVIRNFIPANNRF